jgi:hypothetical protein
MSLRGEASGLALADEATSSHILASDEVASLQNAAQISAHNDMVCY